MLTSTHSSHSKDLHHPAAVAEAVASVDFAHILQARPDMLAAHPAIQNYAPDLAVLQAGAEVAATLAAVMMCSDAVHNFACSGHLTVRILSQVVASTENYAGRIAVVAGERRDPIAKDCTSHAVAQKSEVVKTAAQSHSDVEGNPYLSLSRPMLARSDLELGFVPLHIVARLAERLVHFQMASCHHCYPNLRSLGLCSVLLANLKSPQTCGP